MEEIYSSWSLIDIIIDYLNQSDVKPLTLVCSSWNDNLRETIFHFFNFRKNSAIIIFDPENSFPRDEIVSDYITLISQVRC